jgi:hypothetical protein
MNLNMSKGPTIWSEGGTLLGSYQICLSSILGPVFKDAPRGKICARVFIEMGVCAL